MSFVSYRDNETQLASQKGNFNKNEIKNNRSMDSKETTTKKIGGQIPHLNDVGVLGSSNTEMISLNESKIEYPEIKFTKINTTPLDTLYHSTKPNEQSKFSLETKTTLIECVEDKNSSELIKHIDPPEDNWGPSTTFVELCTEEVNLTSQNESTPLYVSTTESSIQINKESEIKEGEKFSETTTNVFEQAIESEHDKINDSTKVFKSEGVEIFSTIPEIMTEIVSINEELDVSDKLHNTEIFTEKIHSLETYSVAIEENVSREPFAEKKIETIMSTETYDIESTVKEKNVEDVISTETHDIKPTAKEKKIEELKSTETYNTEATAKEKKKEKVLSTEIYNIEATAKEKKKEKVISTETYDIEPAAKDEKTIQKVISTETYDMEPTAKETLLHKSYGTTIEEKSTATINEKELDKESFDVTSTLGEDLFHQPYNITIEEEPSKDFNHKVGMKGKTSDQPYVFETITKGIPDSRLDEFSNFTKKEKLPKALYIEPTTLPKLSNESIENDENIDDGVETKKIYKPGFYVPNADFCPNNGTDLKLIIFVESQLNNFATRMIIRKTWKAYAINESVKIVFFVGVKKDANETLDYECEVFNDIIQSRNTDVHIRHSSLKFLSIIEWLLKYCSKVQFVAKTEEEIFLNIPELLSIVNKLPHEQQSAIYGKYIKDDKRIKQIDDPYYVSDKSYSLDVFPPYPWGRLYLIQKPPLIDLYYLALSSIYVPLDDVWFGGIIAEFIGLKKININNLVKECNNLGPIPDDYNRFAGLCLTTATEIEPLMNKYIKYYY